jgi:hypothetical protein
MTPTNSGCLTRVCLYSGCHRARGTTSSQPSRRQVKNLVGVRVRPDRTDMDIRSIETSDPGQKPVLRTVG